MLTRRTVLKTSGLLGSATVLTRDLQASSLFKSAHEDCNEVASRLRDIAMNELRTLSISYGDIRISHVRTIDVNTVSGFTVQESMGLGIRILYDGHWGFASTSIFNEESIKRSCLLAVEQAKGNSSAMKIEVNTSPYNISQESGEWIMPVKYDPFDRNPYEFEDFLNACGSQFQRYPYKTTHYILRCKFICSESWFGATTGATQYQKLYNTSGAIGYTLLRDFGAVYTNNRISPAGVGYEMFSYPGFFEEMRADMDEVAEVAKLMISPVDIGRYDIVVDPIGTSALIASTIGQATELDRIVGIEANATGSSYLTNPLTEVDSYVMGSPLLNLSVNRNEDGGAASRRWDDEGISMEKADMIQDGVLHKVISDRELAGEFPEVTLQGNFIGHDATYFPSIYLPNINYVYKSDISGMKMSEMIADMDDGIYFRMSGVATDFQLMNGMITGEAIEVKKGKKTSRLKDGSCWFKSSELWNNLSAVSIPSEQLTYGRTTIKGEPASEQHYSVTCPAMKFKDMAIIDGGRKS